MRNEYSLGQPQLYKEVNREDPKAVLDGVAVAGLVGILRQLGDLAEYVALSFFTPFHSRSSFLTTLLRSILFLCLLLYLGSAHSLFILLFTTFGVAVLLYK